VNNSMIMEAAPLPTVKAGLASDWAARRGRAEIEGPH
jgi:hypothetical protein